MKQMAHSDDHPLAISVEDSKLVAIVFDEAEWEESGDCVEQFRIPLASLLVREACDDGWDDPEWAAVFLRDLEFAANEIRCWLNAREISNASYQIPKSKKPKTVSCSGLGSCFSRHQQSPWKRLNGMHE